MLPIAAFCPVSRRPHSQRAQASEQRRQRQYSSQPQAGNAKLRRQSSISRPSNRAFFSTAIPPQES
jgi:hypothetical protein